MKERLSAKQIEAASAAWERGGTLGLGHWAARNLKPLTVEKYGNLVAAVRSYLGDTKDYRDD